MALVPLKPTCCSSIDSTNDACVIIEACFQGYLNLVPRRAYPDELLAKSGNVFVYEGHSSGIELWQDNVVWGPAEPLHGFLVYDELKKLFSCKGLSVDYRAYTIKVGGLVKKTFTAMIGRVSLHLVAYHTKADGVREPRAPILRRIVPRLGMIPVEPNRLMPWDNGKEKMSWN